MTKKIIPKNICETDKKNYFSCADTCMGFINYFDNIFDSQNLEKIYAIKACDKSYSDILNEIAQNAERKKYSVEYFLYPHDLKCLNGIIIKDLKMAVVIENLNIYAASGSILKYPVLIENTVNLCDFYEESKIIKRKKEIFELDAKKNEYINLAYKFLRAANELAENTIQISKKYMNQAKLDSSVDRLINKHINEKHLSGKNRYVNEYKFINSVSASGIIELNTFEKESDKIFYISNENFLGYYYTKRISEKFANSCKIIFPDALNPDKIRAVYLKDSKTLFVIKNKAADKIYDEKYNFINMNRFVNQNLKKDNKQKLRFIQKCYKSIIEEAVKYFKEAENAKNSIEGIYASSIKINEKNKYTEAIIKKILP